MTEQGQVDLSVCRPGDECQYPDGTWGVITAWHYGDGHPWWASRGSDGKEYAHNREGRRDRMCQLEFDIIVVRQQIQPPAHVPDAGQVVGVNKSQFYRDGNVPMVGDIVQCVDDSHVVAEKRSYMRKNGGPLHVVKVGADSSWVCLSNDVFQDWNCTRFNLIARTRTAPDASTDLVSRGPAADSVKFTSVDEPFREAADIEAATPITAGVA